MTYTLKHPQPSNADPRRVVVIASCNSSNPRAQKWYAIAVAAATCEGLFLIYRGVATINNAKRRGDAVEVAQEYATFRGLQIEPGVWKSTLGRSMERVA